MDKKEEWSKFEDESEEKVSPYVDDESENDNEPEADVKTEDKEDSFEKIVSKNYVEVESPGNKSKKEKIPLIFNIGRDVEHPPISNAPEDTPSQTGPEKILYSSDPPMAPLKSVNGYFVAAGVVLAIVIVLAVFLLFVKEQKAIGSNNIEDNNLTVSKKEPVAFISIPVKYSFDEYINPVDGNYNKDASLICFLRKELRSAGEDAQYIDYYAVDDYGNKIKLNFYRLKDPGLFEHLFVTGTTKDLLNVSGSLRKDGYQELRLYVGNISAAQRAYETKEIN